MSIERTGNVNRYWIELGKDEANGQVITEEGLIDENGTLVAVKTFGGKTKEIDTTLVFDWYENF